MCFLFVCNVNGIRCVIVSEFNPKLFSWKYKWYFNVRLFVVSQAFENAITLVMVLGGSTNAVLHLIGTPLFCALLFTSVQFSVFFFSVLFYSILFCSVQFCSILCSVLFCSVFWIIFLSRCIVNCSLHICSVHSTQYRPL
jgi:hypothetical protein